MKAITCIANPTVNSYKRFVPGYEAPVYMSWSAKTRSPLIRVPSVGGEKTRIELRSPDPSANPYLLLAVLLAAGMDGIKNKIMPQPSVDEDIQEMSAEQLEQLHLEALPGSLLEAVHELEKDIFIRGVLGEDLAAKMIAAYKKEYRDYSMQVTEWELANYLYKM